MTARDYLRSSSLKMAMLFSVLLGTASCISGYFIFRFSAEGLVPWLAGVVILLMAMVVMVSFLISRFVVTRTNMIAQTAQEIMETGDFSRRISIEGEWDDLSHMAQVLNLLLERTEQSMQGIRQVADNIAHDLRTPLTRLRNKLEEAGDHALMAEADHLLTTFAALLRISNLELGRRHGTFQPVTLPALLRDVMELYEPLAEEKGIHLTSDMPLSEAITIEGDRNLLFQMLANLLDNAIKFTPQGGHVVVSLLPNEIRIADTGNGIAAADKPRVFERFYRAENSRHSAGNGLGLSLVAVVAKIHHIAILLEDNHSGLVVRLRLTNR